MKFSELESKYSIRRVSFRETLNELYVSKCLKKEGMVYLFLIFSIFRLINNYFGLFLDSTKYVWSYNIILILLSIIFTSYLLQTALENSGKVFSRERLNRSILLLVYIIKTLILFILYIIPLVFLASLAFVIIYMGATSIFEFSNPDGASMIFSIVVAVVISSLLLQYCFATYLVVTHHENGFAAIRLSKLIFRGNVKSSIALFASVAIIPALVLLGVDHYIENIYINIAVDIIVSAIVFAGHFVISSFLTKAGRVKEDTKTDVEPILP